MKPKSLRLAIGMLAVLSVASASAQDEPPLSGQLPDEEVQILSEEQLLDEQAQRLSEELLSSEVILLSDSGWSDPSVGHWDSGTLTATLIKDLTERIVIVGDGITLDGAQHSITGPGSGSYNGVTLYADNVTIKNLNVQGWVRGIYLHRSSYNALTNITASNNAVGIYIYYRSNYNTLTDNTSNNSSIGIYLYFAHYNTLIGNTTSNNNTGIYDYISRNNTLTGNAIWNNNYQGIFLSGNNNILTGNTVAENYGYGIYLYYSASNSQIYHNNFIGNSIQAYVLYSNPRGNVFNLDAPTGGNYWDNWTSPDENPADGFVDSPYVFNNGQDDLPWVVPPVPPTLPPTPLELIDELVDYVLQLNLQEGISNSLDAKIEAALGALDDVNEHNDAAAINSLEAFINAVEAQSGNKISVEDATDLIAIAQAIIDMLLDL